MALRWILLGGLLAALLLLGGYAVFVLTTIGQGLDNLAYSGRETVTGPLAVVDSDLLGEVRIPVIAGAAALVGLAALAFRRIVPGMLAILAMGVAIEGAEVLKRKLERPQLTPLPIQAPAYFSADTYPSGHTTVGTTVALALLMVVGRRTRRVLAPVALVFSLLFATGVFLMGWHRPSDSVGGLLWSGACFAAALLVCLPFARRGPPPEKSPAALWVSSLVGIAVLCLALLAMAGAAGWAFCAFAAFTGAIVFFGAGLFVWAVRSMDLAT